MDNAITENLHDFLLYKERFDSFKTITNEFENVLKWLETNPSMIDFENTRSIISIGGGTGSFDLNFLKLFKQIDRYTVIEPNLYHIQEFIKNAAQESSFEFHNQTFEEFEFTEKQDLALLSHSLYYISDLKGSLIRLSQSCKMTLILHQTTYGIHSLQNRFGDEITQRCVLSSDKIVKSLEELDLSYQRKRIDCHINVKEINDTLIDFIMEKKTTPNEREEIRSYLRQSVPHGIFYHPVDAILIHGPR